MTNREAREIIAHERDNDAFFSEYRNKVHEAQTMAIKALEQTEWTPVKTSDDYPKESGDYLTVLKDTAFHDFTFTDITSFDCEGITAEWDLKPQYKVIAWKAYEPYKGE